jgi:GNAT superfamily N-acetyltransferase
MNLTYSTDYWDDPAAITELIRFLADIHNVDLGLWREKGLWDRKYRPFSFFDGDRLVSSMCIYSMDMSVCGRRCKVAQISAVGTLPEYRRKGLGIELNRRAMEWADSNGHEFFFLFADEEAYPFYNACGFRRVDEHKARIAVSGEIARGGVEKLDIARRDHFDLTHRIAIEREPVSDKLGVLNDRLFMFWCLYFLRDNIYYISDLDLIVLCGRKDNVLTVYDIVGRSVPSFSEIYPYIQNETDSAVEFEFMVDKMGLAEYDLIALGGINGTHLYGDFPLENEKFIFPCTSRA